MEHRVLPAEDGCSLHAVLRSAFQLSESAIRRAKDLKDRYTLFWILENAGLLEAYSQLPLAQEN